MTLCKQPENEGPLIALLPRLLGALYFRVFICLVFSMRLSLFLV